MVSGWLAGYNIAKLNKINQSILYDIHITYRTKQDIIIIINISKYCPYVGI